MNIMNTKKDSPNFLAFHVCIYIYIYIYPSVSNYLSDLPTVYPREIHGCSVLGPDEAGRTEGRDLGMAPGDPNKGNAASRHHYIYTNLYKYIHIYSIRLSINMKSQNV